MLIILCLFAFLAGLVDALVGGGGLIQLPAFLILFPQLSLVQTLASNKTASFLGTCVATFRYVRRVPFSWLQLLPALSAAFVGSLSGALLAHQLHKEQFMPIIIGALAGVLGYTIFKKDFGLLQVPKGYSRRKASQLGLFTGLGIGFYDGLIGPGTGSLLMFAFVAVFGNDFLTASAKSKVLNCVTNLSALLFFFSQGHILWAYALPVGACNMLGSYAGAHLALKKGSGFVRLFFIIIVSALILRLGYDYWRAYRA